jgi:hypothetical protein
MAARFRVVGDPLAIVRKYVAAQRQMPGEDSRHGWNWFNADEAGVQVHSADKEQSAHEKAAHHAQLAHAHQNTPCTTLAKRPRPM